MGPESVPERVVIPLSMDLSALKMGSRWSSPVICTVSQGAIALKGLVHRLRNVSADTACLRALHHATTMT